MGQDRAESLLRLLLRSLPLDIWGSDELSGYTATYAWETNQMAHVMMGFFLGAAGLALVIGLLVSPMRRWPRARPMLDRIDRVWSRWGPRLEWFLALPWIKELIDWLYDENFAPGGFPIDRGALLLDSLADIVFWSIGIGLGISLHRRSARAFWLTVLVGGAFAVPLGVSGWAEKQRFDRTGIPYCIRLSHVDTSGIQPEAIGELRRYLETRGPRSHLILQGSSRVAATPLAMGLGCELSARGNKVRYVTAFELREWLNASRWGVGEARSARGPIAAVAPWPLAEVEFLIVAEVDSDRPLWPEGTTAADLSRLFRAGTPKTIWVVSGPSRRWERDVRRWLGDERLEPRTIDLTPDARENAIESDGDGHAEPDSRAR